MPKRGVSPHRLAQCAWRRLTPGAGQDERCFRNGRKGRRGRPAGAVRRPGQAATAARPPIVTRR
ncbi:hypothetical protein EMIT0158MI4_30484 [Burkholderia ambifaria]